MLYFLSLLDWMGKKLEITLLPVKLQNVSEKMLWYYFCLFIHMKSYMSSTDWVMCCAQHDGD